MSVISARRPGLGRRLIALAAAAAAWCTVALAAPASPAAAASMLTSPVWTVSSSTTGATGVTYTFTFTTPAALLTTIGSVTMTVPPGTSGTPVLGAVTPGGLGGAISFSGTTLTYSGISLGLLGATDMSIQVTGLTNTATAGNYTSQITTFGPLGGLLSTGTTPAVAITGLLRLTAPSSLGWSATLNGTNQSVVDATAGDQQFTVDDETLTGSGWHITAAALTFTTGARTLANSGTLSLTGSVTAAAATAGPTVTCLVSCGAPSNTTTYPVAITTAASAPTPATIFSALASSGLGPAVIGGSSAANPVGWWVSVPASVRAGSYTSTVTIAVVSGP